ncbi:MAG: hypothetical protein WBA61_07080 [Aequorivita sp.]
MNTINFSKGELNVCHKNSCVIVNGKMGKAIIFGLATLIVLNGINSMLESAN